MSTAAIIGKTIADSKPHWPAPPKPPGAARRDRGSPVSHYAAPFEFSGKLFSVSVTLQAQKGLGGNAVDQAEMGRQ